MPGRPRYINRRFTAPRIPQGRFAWCDTIHGTTAARRIKHEDLKEQPNPQFAPEAGDMIILEVPGRGDIYISLDLTVLTAKELEYFETVIARAIEAARPICKERDANADAANESGLEAYSRTYRQIPQLFVRERPI